MTGCPACRLTRNSTVKILTKSFLREPRILQIRPLSLQHVNVVVPGRRKRQKIGRRIHSQSFSTKSTEGFGRELHRHEILTLLHKTSSLIPRALTPRTHSGALHPVESYEFWNDLLSGAYEDLTSTLERPAHVVVYGADEWSETQDLVTALLEVPLSSDETQNERLRSRWKNRVEHGSLTISHGTSPVENSSTLQTPSPYLLQFSLPLQITELPFRTPPLTDPRKPGSLTLPPDEAAIAALFKADIPIVVCNPATILISEFLRNPLPTNNPNAILIVTSTSSAPLSEIFTRFIPREGLPDISRRSLTILPMHPARAVTAINTFLKADTKSPSAVQRYQDDFVGSRVSTLTAALRTALPSGQKSPAAALRARTTLSQIQGALSASRVSLKRARDEADGVSAAVSQLAGRIEEARARMEREVLRSSSGNPTKQTTDVDIVLEALKGAEKEMRGVMDRLTWWRMVWRVDEISLIVREAVENAWCRELERQLILQTGRLSAIQDEFTKSIFSLLSAHTTPPFDSAVIYSSLLQLISFPSYPLTSRNLTFPINTRRAQINEYSTTRLHVAGQRAVLGMSGGVATGIGVSWAGWMGWLVGSGEGLFWAVGMDAGTAIGVGMLGAVASVRWAVGKWERSKRQWWEDWNRVGDGLSRDLRHALDRTMRENVLVVAEMGCDRLSELVMKRKAEIEEIEEELEILQVNFRDLEQRTKAPLDAQNIF